MSTITSATVWLHAFLRDVGHRARAEADHGEVVEKVIIAAAAAALAIATMAAIALLVGAKVASIQL